MCVCERERERKRREGGIDLYWYESNQAIHMYCLDFPSSTCCLPYESNWLLVICMNDRYFCVDDLWFFVCIVLPIVLVAIKTN